MAYVSMTRNPDAFSDAFVIAPGVTPDTCEGATALYFGTNDDGSATLRVTLAGGSHICIDLRPDAATAIAMAFRGEGRIVRAGDPRSSAWLDAREVAA